MVQRELLLCAVKGKALLTESARDFELWAKVLTIKSHRISYRAIESKLKMANLEQSSKEKKKIQKHPRQMICHKYGFFALHFNLSNF